MFGNRNLGSANSSRTTNNAASMFGNLGSANSERAKNNAASMFGNRNLGSANSSRTTNNAASMFGNLGSTNSGRAENNAASMFGNLGSANSGIAPSNETSNFGNGNNNSGKSLTNFLGENNRNSRVIEQNEEENEEDTQQPQQNSNKSIFSTIGESFGITSSTSSTPSQNNNTIKTNMKKAKCEGEDCDIFSEDVKTSEINIANLGKKFTNGVNRYNNARKKIMELLGEQITTSKTNNQGKISNFPREGDITTYIQQT
jgi:hypothetical protein